MPIENMLGRRMEWMSKALRPLSACFVAPDHIEKLAREPWIAFSSNALSGECVAAVIDHRNAPWWDNTSVATYSHFAFMPWAHATLWLHEYGDVLRQYEQRMVDLLIAVEAKKFDTPPWFYELEPPAMLQCVCEVQSGFHTVAVLREI